MDAVDAAAWPDDAVVVGRVLGAWGVKGWVRVQPFSSDPQALFSSRQWLLAALPPDADIRRPPARAMQAKVAQAREHGDGVVAQLHDVSDRAAAEGLRGLSVVVPRSRFPTPDPGEYYWVDLIGCAVVNREGTRLGVVDDLFTTGPNSVLRVRDRQPGDPAMRERLIPFVAAYVDDVRVAERRIVVDWGVDD
jgi:16S rRNA processing protein RimM